MDAGSGNVDRGVDDTVRAVLRVPQVDAVVVRGVQRLVVEDLLEERFDRHAAGGLDALLAAAENAKGDEARAANASRLLVFVSQTLRGERYPPGRGRLPSTTAEDDARAQLVKVLLDGDAPCLARYLGACVRGAGSLGVADMAHAAWLPFLDATDGWDCALASGARAGQALFDAGTAMLQAQQNEALALATAEEREACAYACAFLACRGRARVSGSALGAAGAIVSALLRDGRLEEDHELLGEAEAPQDGGDRHHRRNQHAFPQFLEVFPHGHLQLVVEFRRVRLQELLHGRSLRVVRAQRLEPRPLLLRRRAHPSRTPAARVPRVPAGSRH